MQRPRGLRNLLLRLAILPAALLLAFYKPSLAAECAPPRLENTVKMEPLGDQGLMVVPITLDGLEKKFLFDTGGSANYISGAVVQDLKLPQFGSPAVMDMRGNRSDSAVIVKDVMLGATKGSFVPFQVASHLPFDGILSARALAKGPLNAPRDDLDMDFGALKLNFFSADHCEGAVVYWPHQTLAVVPVTPMQGHIELPVTLDGHPLRAAIDTGAPWTILNLARATQKLDFSADAGASQSRDVPKDDPAKQIYFRKYAALSLEGITIANPLIIVRPVDFGGPDDPTILASRAQHAADFANRLAPDIIIGMEILRHLHVYYAVKEHKLYITPAGSASTPKAAAPSDRVQP